MPAGDTRDGVSSVTAPITPTRTPDTSRISYSGSAGVCVPFRYTLAPRYFHLAFAPLSITRPVRSSKPWSNSWLPTAEALSCRALRTSIGRLVLRHRGGEQRGADAVAGGQQHRVAAGGLRGSTFGFHGPGELHRVGVDPAVEVVDVQQRQVDRPRRRRRSALQSEDHRVVVRGGVRRIVVEQRAVVVVPAVLQCNGFAGVDVPDVRAGDRCTASSLSRM